MQVDVLVMYIYGIDGTHGWLQWKYDFMFVYHIGQDGLGIYLNNFNH